MKPLNKILHSKFIFRCVLVLSVVCVFRTAVKAQQLALATYNLRNDSPFNDDSVRGNGWKQRLPVIAKLIQFHDFDIFGTQEGLFHQLENLENAMPEYAYTGIGRDDGKTAGEYSAIFYKKTGLNSLIMVISGCRKLRINQIKAGMPFYPEYVPGAAFRKTRPASDFIFLTCTWIISG